MLLNQSDVLTAMDDGNAGNAGRSLPAVAPPAFRAGCHKRHQQPGFLSGFVVATKLCWSVLQAQKRRPEGRLS
ncbi:MAG: hypothetical protein CMI03_13375 [Oceanospirillaceae bacterium]|nr:hypothetical protein [Oceanospirillaceae bacterium]